MIRFCNYGPEEEDDDWAVELDFYDLMNEYRNKYSRGLLHG